jgi:HPt (histidine-containing phosphotransfer) domain-containing protein
METVENQFTGALNRLGNDRELFRELASFFRDDAPGLLAAIHSGLAVGNAEETMRAAHSLRSLVSNFDAENAARIAGSIEQSARKGELQSLPAALAELEVEVQALQSALKEYAAQAPRPTARK